MPLTMQIQSQPCLKPETQGGENICQPTFENICRPTFENICQLTFENICQLTFENICQLTKKVCM